MGHTIYIHPSLFTIAVGDALSSMNKVNILPAFFSENEKFRFVNKFLLPTTAVFLAFLFSFSGYKYTNYSKLSIQVPQERIKNEKRNKIRTVFNDNIKKRKVFDEQVEKMSYDINYSNRVSEILRYVSNITERDMQIDYVDFHYGWEEVKTKMAKGKKMVLRDLKDEDKRFISIAGKIKTNPVLQLRYFQTFQQKLRQSDLFYDITVLVARENEVAGYFSFTLRCEF